MLRIVKIGGAAFTDKATHETLNDENFSTILNAMKILAPNPEEDSLQTVIIHGAGSFGYFEAKKYNLQQGISQATSQEGVALTRRSVTKLNSMLVDKLVENGIPAVGVSPFGSWETTNGIVSKHNISAIAFMLRNGLIPVMHGDVVMDVEKGCSILSGDTLVEMLALALRPKFVVFVTDVAGVYNMPPHLPQAKLLSEIFLENDERKEENMEQQTDVGLITSNGYEHDVTGGMTQKLRSAKAIARGGIPVHIVNSHVKNLEKILENGESPEIGTTVRSNWS